MSIVTKTGDDGTTSLMYNRRVSKCDERVEACGTVDELNAALGLARASSASPAHRDLVRSIQRDLILIMGELATAPEDRQLYVSHGHAPAGAVLISKVEARVRELEARLAKFSGWAIPGETPAAAALDLARTICRRAERQVCRLRSSGEPANPEIQVFLNRLSDLLWLLAREAEAPLQP